MAASSLDAEIRNFVVKTGIISFLTRTSLSDPLLTIWRFIHRPQQEMDLLADYYSFKRKYGFLAQGDSLADPAKKVLVVSLTDWIAQVKAEATLAKALQLRGYTPIVVTRRSYGLAVKYFRVFGYDRFVFFDQLLQQIPAKPVISEAERILSEGLSFQSILNLQYRNVNVGRHVLSSITRALLRSTVQFSDPQVQELVRQLLPNAMLAVRGAELLLDRVRPQIALFLEKGYTPYGEIFDLAVNREINTIQWVHSHRSDALILKRYARENQHIHPFSISGQSWKSIQRIPWTARREAELMQEIRGRYEEGTWFNRKYLHVGKKLKNPTEVREQLGLDSTRKLAVIFSHVLWDATFFFGENLFDDYEQWLLETVKAACANPATNWVVKVHPDYVWKMKQLGERAKPRDLIALGAEIGDLPEHIKVLEPDTDISTFSLFPVTDYCVTVRGTIGIEMACFGIPVFTAGTGRYSGLGFTIDSHTREDYLAKLRHIQNFPRLSREQILLAKKHAYGLFRIRPYKFQTFEMVQMPLNRLGHPLDHNVVIRAKCFRDIVEAQDLKTFSEWAANSQQLDLLTFS